MITGWEPFIKEQKKVKVKKETACFFSARKIFPGDITEMARFNERYQGVRKTVNVHACLVCDDCKHVLQVRKSLKEMGIG